MRRYRFTPARRTALKVAQRKSARKRLAAPNKLKKKTMSGKNTLGYWVAKGVNKTISAATMGVGPSLISVIEGKKRTQKRQMYRWKK